MTLAMYPIGADAKTINYPLMKQILSIPEQLVQILQSARKSAGLSQGVLSKRMGMSQSRMSAIELDPASMRLEQLLSICAILQLELVVQTKVTPEQFLNGSIAQEW